MAVSTLKTSSGAMLVDTVRLSTGMTIAANSVASNTQSVNCAKDGYSVIGIVGIESNNNYVNILRANVTSTGQIYARVSNLSSSQITGVNIDVKVLYERM